MLIPWHEWCFIYLFPGICCRIQVAVKLKKSLIQIWRNYGACENNLGLPLPTTRCVIWPELARTAHFPPRDECVSWIQAPRGTKSSGFAGKIPSLGGQRRHGRGSLGLLSLPHPWGFPHPLRESPEQSGLAQELEKGDGLETSSNPARTIFQSCSITGHCPSQDSFLKTISGAVFFPSYPCVLPDPSLPAPLIIQEDVAWREVFKLISQLLLHK